MDTFSLTFSSPILSLLLLLPVLILLTLLSTLVFTTLRYHFSRLTSSQYSRKPQPPAYLPYTLPFLGHALSFLTPRPGAFWTDLITRRISRAAGSVTLLLGGQVTNVLFSPFAVQALFKAKGLTRHPFNVQVVMKGFDMGPDDCKKLYGTDGRGRDRSKRRSKSGSTVDNIPSTSVDALQEQLTTDYLLTQSAVNELTSKFTEMLRDELAKEPAKWEEVSLYEWMKHHMFTASTIAFMGSRILETYPALAEDFFAFDSEFLRMFFGLPKFIAPEGFNARDRCLDGLTRWVGQNWEEYRRTGREGPTPKETGWDPIFGSRIVQAREQLLAKNDFTMRGRASLHLGFLFGLASNAIPASGWMLMHIVSPDADATLLPRVTAEARSARLEDGTLDIPTLISLPLLQSIFHETLRMYVDVLVTREVIDSDLVLPVDATGNRQILLKQNSTVMAPSWLGHRDADAWGDSPPADVFFPERFLKVDEKTGREMFSISGVGGKFFPFGGGRNICPGRVFAKQEVLASVAMILLGFDVDFQGYVDVSGTKTQKFPGLRKGFVGNGVMAMDGDMKVKIKRRL